ncbi:MAG: phage head closure protein [Clostridia bacterium]|nr:phage head closure protein [Clostridia bacterium]
MIFKPDITNLPTYNDGYLKLYQIKQKEKEGTAYPIEYLVEFEDSKNTGINYNEIWFEELSLTDKLKFDAEERKKKITYKIRIPQLKEIDSLCVVEINGKYHKVFNAYHFTNEDGFKQSDLTLEEYPRAKFEKDVIENDD